uniref:Uncharacterized protein n=1 Tax=Aegilops tauschii subsp. strangulata TaxID=200361 RepID=A0A453FGP6_AEGTS
MLFLLSGSPDQTTYTNNFFKLQRLMKAELLTGHRQSCINFVVYIY